MIVEVEFTSGEVWELQSLYISDFKHYTASEEAYYILPQSDIKISRVTVEESAKMMRDAKSLPSIVGQDIGMVLCKNFDEPEKPKPKMAWKSVSSPTWKEVKPSPE